MGLILDCIASKIDWNTQFHVLMVTMNVLFFRPSSKPSRWLTKRSACLPWWSLDRTRWSRGSPHLLTTATGRITYVIFYLIIFSLSSVEKSQLNIIELVTQPDQIKLEVPAELILPHTLPPLSHQTIAQQLHSLQGLDTDQHLMDQVVSVIQCVPNFSRFRLPKTPKGRKVRGTIFLGKLFLYS